MFDIIGVPYWRHFEPPTRLRSHRFMGVSQSTSPTASPAAQESSSADDRVGHGEVLVSTPVLAELVGAAGRVTAIEFDAKLAARASANFARTPQV